MLILDLLGLSFHAVIVFGLGKNLLLKSVLGRCGDLLTLPASTYNSFKTSFNLIVVALFFVPSDGSTSMSSIQKVFAFFTTDFLSQQNVVDV